MINLSRWTPRQRVVLFLILAASCFRVFICFQHNPMDYLASDMARHWSDGVNFPATGLSDPILYQVYIYLLSHLTGGQRLLIALASSLLSVFMPWTYYRAAREFGLKETAALWVWALIAWTPSLLVIYHYIMMETLLLLLEGVALWMTGRYLRKGGTRPFLDMVFFWTLAALTKPTVIPLAGICVLWCIWKKLPSLRTVGFGALVVVLLLLPSAIRSKAQLGFVAPFGNSWFIKIQHRSGARTIYLNFYTHPNIFNRNPVADDEFHSTSPSCYVKPLSPLSDWELRRSSDTSRIVMFIDSANGEQDWKNRYAALNVSRQEWLAQWRENMVYFLFAPSWPESIVLEWDGHMELEARWMWAPLIVFVLIANLWGFLHRRLYLIPVAVTLFALFLALQNVVTFEGRYRKPLEPLLMLNLVWVLAVKPDEKTSDVA